MDLLHSHHDPQDPEVPSEVRFYDDDENGGEAQTAISSLPSYNLNLNLNLCPPLSPVTTASREDDRLTAIGRRRGKGAVIYMDHGVHSPFVDVANRKGQKQSSHFHQQDDLEFQEEYNPHDDEEEGDECRPLPISLEHRFQRVRRSRNRRQVQPQQQNQHNLNYHSNSKRKNNSQQQLLVIASEEQPTDDEYCHEEIGSVDSYYCGRRCTLTGIMLAGCCLGLVIATAAIVAVYMLNEDWVDSTLPDNNPKATATTPSMAPTVPLVRLHIFGTSFLFFTFWRRRKNLLTFHDAPLSLLFVVL
jgi:hypothetical protein